MAPRPRRLTAVKDAATDDQGAKASDAWQKLGAGFASGVGAIGLVVFTGGALQWLRFDRADLPPAQSVAAMSKNELLVLGAQSLVFFLVAGGALMLLAYLVDDKGRAPQMLLVSLGAAAGGLVFLWLHEDLSAGSKRWLIAVAVVLIVIVVGVSLRTQARFLWVGATIFMAVVVFGSVSEYLINHDAPKVQPVALLRGPDDFGLVGVYVAFNNNRLYVRQLDTGSDARGRRYRAGLYVFPCTAVTALAIGRFQRPGPNNEDAAHQAVWLLQQLRAARELSTRKDGTQASTATAPAKTIC